LPHARQRHLLVVTTNYAETHGGVEVHLERLLPLLVDRGVEATVAYLGERGEPYTEPSGVHVIPVRRRFDFRDIMALPSWGDWREFSHLVANGLPGRPPVTHVATHTRFFPLSWLGVRLARQLRVPSVHTEHGGGFVVTASPLVRTASRMVDRTMGRSVLRGADRVLGVSRASNDFVRELSGVEAETFGNGLDLASWLPDASAPDRDASSEPRPLVFIGRIVEEKGWRAFLDAAAAAEADGWRGETWLIGKGNERDTALERARELGIRRLVAPGQLPSEEVRDALRGAVYVNPSVAAEGFQLTQVEALAAGASLVTYEVGVATELASTPGLAVSLIDRGDASALSDAVRDELDRPAPRPTFEQLARWDWGRLADAYVEVLDDVERASRRSPRP